MSRVRDLRIARGLSQEAVARAIGVTAKTVSSWESSRRKPFPRNQRRLAKLLGVEVQELGFG